MTSDEYDRLADRFYKQTGLIAPGKDAPPCWVPPEGYGAVEHEMHRRKRWCAFVKEHGPK